MAEQAGIYEIEWEKKPLGFSIVMDTTGRNAYVSSIQKEDNKKKGLKLAAQIIAINGTDVRKMDHKIILGKIKSAQLPIKLRFQPRSFANDPQETSGQQEKENVPTPITFTGATVNEHRINGCFELVKEMHNGRHQWQRNDDLEDPVILWYWPTTEANNSTGKNLWMIGRRSFRNSQNAYACCPSDVQYPTQINPENVKWECYDPDKINPKTGKKGAFSPCKIHIKQEKF